MDHSNLTAALVLTAIVLFGAGASAQPQVGDVVFGKYDTAGPGAGLFWVDGGGKLGTILLTGGGRYPNAIMPSDDNRSLIVCLSGTPSRVMQVTTAGAVTTLLGALPAGSPNAIVRDQDGTWLISTSGTNALLRLDPATLGITTVYAHGSESSGIVNGVTVDPDTQDYLVAVYASGTSSLGGIYRVDRGGTLIGTVASGAAWREISSVAWDHFRGRPTVTKFTAPQFVGVTAGGGVTSIATVPWANAQRFDGEANAWVAGDQSLRRIDGATGKTLSVRTLAGYQPTALIGYGDRPLRTSGSAATNSTLTFHLNSIRAGDAGKSYYLAFAQQYQPGVRVADGRVIHIGYGDFLLANLQGLLDPWWSGRGNRNTLDAKGSAVAGFTIPSFVPTTAKYRFHAVFLTLDPAAPTGLGTVGNTVPFTTNR